MGLRESIESLRLSIVGRCRSVSLTRAVVDEHNRTVDAALSSLPVGDEVTRAAERVASGEHLHFLEDAQVLARAILAGQGAGDKVATEMARGVVLAHHDEPDEARVQITLGLLRRLTAGAK